MFEEPYLLVNTAGVACQAAIRTDDPVARDNERDGIVPYRTADCLRRHSGETALLGNFSGNFAICHGGSEWNLKHEFPNGLSEIRTEHGKGRSEVRSFAGKIDIQPALRLGEDRKFLFFVFVLQGIGEIFLLVEPEAGECRTVATQSNSPYGRFLMFRIMHTISPNTLSCTACRDDIRPEKLLRRYHKTPYSSQGVSWTDTRAYRQF